MSELTKEEIESTRCPECQKYHGAHALSCSLITVSYLLILVDAAKRRDDRNAQARDRLREQIAAWQAKYAVVRHENNNLRRRLYREMKDAVSVMDDEELAALIAGLQDVQAGRVRALKRLSDFSCDAERR